MKADGPRQYRMTARGEASARTGERIVAACVELYLERWIDEITLDAVAERAGVSTRTLLRRYGSRDGLVAAVSAVLAAQVAEQRFDVAAGDARAAVGNVLTHYEARGRLALRNIAQAQRSPSVAALAEHGRLEHRSWVRHAFGPQLDRCPEPDREVLVAQLVVLTDVTVWHLLRHDLGLSRALTETVLLGLVLKALGEGES